jgi:formyltetrahydrofolate hydrolase
MSNLLPAKGPIKPPTMGGDQRSAMAIQSMIAQQNNQQRMIA